MTYRLYVQIGAMTGLLLGACGADEGVRTGERQGSAGASCLQTNDCVAPLECFANVCADPSGQSPDEQADATSLVDTPSPSDTAGVESGDDTASAPDAGSDVPPAAPDVPPLPDDPGPLPDTPNDVLNPVGDCEDLGVASQWSGNFEGEVDYDLGQPIPNLIEKDILPVDGILSFEISCIESKLVVLGEMNGNALGANPFTMKLQGGFNPSTQTMTAKMVDAQVTIFGLVEVYFEGDFAGEITASGDFEGTWGGAATGNNVNLTGVVALGTGTWDAAPQ